MNLPLLNIAIPAGALLCYVFLLLVFLYSKKTRVRRIYSVFLIFMSVWSLGSLLMRINMGSSSLFWNRVMVAGIIGIPILFYHFSIAYTECESNKNILIVGYLGAILLEVINFEGYIVTSATMIDGALDYNMGWGAVLFALWGVGFVFLSVINIIRQMKNKKMPLEKVSLILIGMACSQIGTLLNFIPSVGQYPVDIALNCVNAFLIFYSIYRYRFLGTRLIIRKIFHTATNAAIQIIIFLISLLLFYIFLREEILVSAVLSGIIVAVINSAISDKVRMWTTFFIDKLFYKDRISQKTALRDFTENLSISLEIGEINEYIIKVLNVTIQPERIYIFIEPKEGEDFKCISRSAAEDVDLQRIVLNQNHPLIKWFKGNNILSASDVNNNSYFNSLWSVEKKQIENMKIELIVPVKLRGYVIGMVALGEKNDSTPYQKDDIDTLLTIVNGAAASFENARNYSMAKVQAITDGLTELYNHRYFYEYLEEQIYNKQHKYLSVVMMDVDYFKFYNDLYGHSAGDKALKIIAGILRKSMSSKDIACRYGGEEFALILIDKTSQETFEIVEKIREDIQRAFDITSDTNQFISVSAGIAEYPSNALVKEDLLEKADKAMYFAKKCGRNRCIIYNDTMKDGSDKKDNGILMASVYALAAAIDIKDHYTFGHSDNVSNYGVMLGRALGFSEEKLEIIKNAGLLHDVGKIGVPESILTKPDKLTREEYDIMKKHVELSVDIFKHIPNLVNVIPAVICHHERYDGKGYPRGISGENIPEEARCLAVVDAFDAMISHRPYKEPLTLAEAINQLEVNKGTQFDSRMVDVFINLIKENPEVFTKGTR